MDLTLIYFSHIAFLHIFHLHTSLTLVVKLPFLVFFIKLIIYFARPKSLYQYSLTSLLPMYIHSIHYFCHWSSFVDLTLVMVGPRARCAPEQFEHKNTPKLRDAPEWIKKLHVGPTVPQSAHYLLEGLLLRTSLNIFYCCGKVYMNDGDGDF